MAEIISGTTFFYALLGGFLPAIFWLLFWLQEDRKKPEPRGMLILSFVSGMAAVPLAVFLQETTLSLGIVSFENAETLSFAFLSGVIVWSAIEEILKYLAVYIGAFKTRYFDEPIDAVIYMITAALGFAALENTLFLVGAHHSGGVIEWFLTGNSRFIGATVLHTAASSLVGIAIGMTFYRRRATKRIALVVGLFTATLLHAAFNFLIIQGNGNIFHTFTFIWGVVLAAMLAFEKVRRVRPRSRH